MSKRRGMTLFMALGLLAAAAMGCGGGQTGDGSRMQAEAGEKTLVLGDTTFNAENGEPDINPHNDNSGWACIRYGVGGNAVSLYGQHGDGAVAGREL